MECERRHHERVFPNRLVATVLTASEKRELRLMDVSEGGLGFFCSAIGSLEVGGQISVIMEAEAPREAIVRYITPHPHGGFHVGVEWKAN
ncbi:MAG: PilZ domain-containing protein [Planctomycetota bacterium]